jgi:hypothetical protein
LYLQNFLELTEFLVVFLIFFGICGRFFAISGSDDAERVCTGLFEIIIGGNSLLRKKSPPFTLSKWTQAYWFCACSLAALAPADVRLISDYESHRSNANFSWDITGTNGNNYYSVRQSLPRLALPYASAVTACLRGSINLIINI